MPKKSKAEESRRENDETNANSNNPIKKRKRSASSKREVKKVNYKADSASSDDEDFNASSESESSEGEIEEVVISEDEVESKEEEKQEVKETKKRSKETKKRSKRNEEEEEGIGDEGNVLEWKLYSPTKEELDKEYKPTLFTAEPPQELSESIQLLKFQRESLHWMIHQENETMYKGGVLADDMGMGKTLQAICLLLKTRGQKVKNALSDSSCTLVVAPVVALHQWQSEIKKYTKPNSLNVLIFHGPNRLDHAEEIKKYDVILTSYSTIETDYRQETKGFKRKGEVIKKASVLHSIHWNRVILDEAHSIKDRTSSTARSVFNLNSDSRWSLTGTPLQNRIGELFSLVRFLRITPWSYYYCNKCDCKSLVWKFIHVRVCDQCGHSGMCHFSWWNKFILNPIKKHGMGNPLSEKAMKILKHILQRIMLRRTKVEKAEDMCLPPRIIRVRYADLDEEEDDFYSALYTQSKTKFQGFVNEGTVLNNYAHVFDLLLRLRQAVDHPYLVLYAKEAEGAEEQQWCSICQDPVEDPVTAKCSHVFCRTCVESFIQNSEERRCPSCHKALTVDLSQKSSNTKKEKAPASQKQSIIQRVDLTNWRSSTKIEVLMEELTKIKQNNLTAKSLIFSQFVNFLDLIEWRLKLAGFGCVKLDGRMSMQQKQVAIDKFNNDPETTVFLISLKAGGIALNLTVANHCFLLDPWWNPAAEFQAIDRIYRLGQYKCISAIRIIIPNTIEERILQLQEKKHLLFNSTVGMDDDALARLTVDDLKFLFH